MPRPTAGPQPQPFLPHACASVVEVASAPTVMVRAASVPAAILVYLSMMNFLRVFALGQRPVHDHWSWACGIRVTGERRRSDTCVSRVAGGVLRPHTEERRRAFGATRNASRLLRMQDEEL